MYALILAGGKGERLRPLTDSIPKPLAPLNGKPILWYQVEWLKRVGVTHVIFLVGYRWEMVREYFGDGAAFGIKPIYSVETKPLGRGGAIRSGMAHVPEEEDKVIVLNGDIITDQDPNSLLAHFADQEGSGPGTPGKHHGNADGQPLRNSGTGRRQQRCRISGKGANALLD